ncbi:MAG: 2-oxoacid:acceptor oxidoreductase family protein [Bacteroidales bacterium]|nr:2-oxoacid:acceptor oxidoreductase family protein [Bacteroidales bacterium]
MTDEIIIAGFGGQGVLSMGKIMAYAGMMQEMYVSWMPSYGPEMRGGTANVTVILSEEPVSSPILRNYDTAIILSQQALDKFEPLVRKGGTLLYDSNGIIRVPQRNDIQIYSIDAAAEAARLKSLRTYNMIMLGAYLRLKPLLKIDNVQSAIKKSIPARYHHLFEENMKALDRGMKMIEEVLCH